MEGYSAGLAVAFEDAWPSVQYLYLLFLRLFVTDIGELPIPERPSVPTSVVLGRVKGAHCSLSGEGVYMRVLVI